MHEQRHGYLTGTGRCWAAQDDLVCMPQKAAAALGGFGPLALCTRVSNALTLTDPGTLRSVLLDVRPCACALQHGMYIEVYSSVRRWPRLR